MFNKIALLLLSLFYREGFYKDTLIATKKGLVPIEQLKVNDSVLSYDFEQQQIVESKIKRIKKVTHSKYCRVTIDNRKVTCACGQMFFCPLNEEERWVQAQYLQKGDFIFKSISETSTISNIELVNDKADFYSLTIDQTGNYFVSDKSIFVHNEPVTLTLGAIAGYEVVVNLGIPTLIGGFVWLGRWLCGTNRPTNKEIALGTICGGVAKKYYADKAPGKPGMNDGYVPPKRGNGRKVKHEDSGEYGWIDKDGKIWIPTGPKGHGGPHWDVEKPDGSYDNVFPGGKVRPGRR